MRTKIQKENLEQGYRLEDNSPGCHGAWECPVSVHFLSDQGWHSSGQKTGFIFKQRLPPFLSSGEIRYSKHVSFTHSGSNSVTHHKTGTPTQLLHCTNDLYTHKQTYPLSLYKHPLSQCCHLESWPSTTTTTRAPALTFESGTPLKQVHFWLPLKWRLKKKKKSKFTICFYDSQIDTHWFTDCTSNWTLEKHTMHSLPTIFIILQSELV